MQVARSKNRLLKTIFSRNQKEFRDFMFQIVFVKYVHYIRIINKTFPVRHAECSLPVLKTNSRKVKEQSHEWRCAS